MKDRLFHEAERQFSGYREWGADGFSKAMASIRNAVASATELSMDDEAFVLFWFSYQLRCHYFHGEQPAPVVVFADDYRLRCLSFAGDKLEEYLERELPKWFLDPSSLL